MYLDLIIVRAALSRRNENGVVFVFINPQTDMSTMFAGVKKVTEVLPANSKQVACMCADENPERRQERLSDKVRKPQTARCSCLILSISLSTNLLKVPCGERPIRINTEVMTPMQILAIFNLNCHITSTAL